MTHIEKRERQIDILKIQSAKLAELIEAYEVKRVNSFGITRVAYERLIFRFGKLIHNCQKETRLNESIIRRHEQKI